MQIEIVWHDDSANNADRLQKFFVSASATPWNDHAFGDGHLIGRWHHVLIAKCDRHNGDEQTEEAFQFAQTVLVQKQKCKCIDDCN